jgi:Yip1-like protein
MTTTTPATNSFLQRLMGAAALDTAIYEEVEADPKAGIQAAAVVVLSSLAAGIGSRGLSQNSLPNIALISILALMAWACWAVVTYEIGGRLMPEPQTSVDIGQLMRTIGFAATPGLLRVFGFIPGVTIPAFAVATIWMLLAMIVAIRQALDYKSTGRAVAVCALGWALAMVFVFVLGLAFGPSVS